MMILEQTLRLLLDGIGRSDEYEFYLSRFRSQDSPCFCVLVADKETLINAKGAIVAQLEFLRRLDLYPALLLAGMTSSSDASAQYQNGSLFRGISISADSFYKISAEELTGMTRSATAEKKIPVFLLDSVPLEKAVIGFSVLTKRFHFLRLEGALKDDNGLIPYVDPANGSPQVEGSLTQMIGWIQEQAPVHVSLCAPLLLLNEMFTVKGSGTVFRKRSNIQFSQTPPRDRVALAQLLESSFGRKLKDESCIERANSFYIEQNFRGAILLESSVLGDYLSKFAVTQFARGEGIAQDLWNLVSQKHTRLFWRAKRGNPIEKWYARLADGWQRSGKWSIFWTGIEPEKIKDVIRYCLERPEDFEQK